MVEPMFAEPHHVVLGAFQAEIELAEDVILGTSEFGGGGSPFLESLNLAKHQAKGLFQVCGIEAGGDDDVARIGPGRESAVDVVGEAVMFPDRLEEAGTHVLAEDDVEDSQGMPTRVMSGDGTHAEFQVGLFDVLDLHADTWAGGLGSPGFEGSDDAGSEGPRVESGASDQVRVLQVAGGGDEGGRSGVVGIHVPQEVRPAKSLEGGAGPDDRSAEGVSGELRGIEEVVHQFCGLVPVHGEFLEDHVAFAGNVGRGETGIQEHVDEDLEQVGPAIGVGAGVEAGVFLVGEGVEVSTDALDGLGDGCGRAGSGALEEEVFDEMGDAVDGGGLVPAPDADPDPDGDGGHVGHLGGDDTGTVGEESLLIHGVGRCERKGDGGDGFNSLGNGPPGGGGRRSGEASPVRSG